MGYSIVFVMVLNLLILFIKVSARSNSHKMKLTDSAAPFGDYILAQLDYIINSQKDSLIKKFSTLFYVKIVLYYFIKR
jgi:hypothetical protein